MKTKQCSRCGEIKPLTEFHKCSANPDGLRCECKTCVLLDHKNYRQNNHNKIKEGKKRWRKVNLEKARKWTREWKIVSSFGNIRRYLEAFYKYDGLCAFGCGAEAYLVHHLDGKNVRNSKIDQVNNDLDNLLPLCNPCHTSLHRVAQHRKKLSLIKERMEMKK